MKMKLCFPDNFTITCKNCNSTNCAIDDDFYGSSTQILCLNCKEYEFLQDENYDTEIGKRGQNDGEN